MVTIQDVARAAGVSTATVSRVMNRSGYVSEKTRKKVLEALKSLNYSPNPFAKGLITRKSELIGYVLTNIENPAYVPTARGIQDAAWARHYQVLIYNTDGNEAREIEFLSHLRRIRVDGIIHDSVETPESHLIRRHLSDLMNDGVPIVMLGTPIEGVRVDRVSINNLKGVHLVVEHLVQLGHRRIAFIGGPEKNFIAEERLTGFAKSMESFGIDVDSELIRHADFRESGGYAEAAHLLAMERPPTAIAAANDLMAIGVLRRARDNGVRVPEELAVTGFDDTRDATLVFPSLTSVVVPSYDIGKRSVAILFERIDGVDRLAEEIFIEPEISVRESTVPSPARHARRGAAGR